MATRAAAGGRAGGRRLGYSAKEGRPKRRPGSGFSRPAAPRQPPGTPFGVWLDWEWTERKVRGNWLIFFFMSYEHRRIWPGAWPQVVGHEVVPPDRAGLLVRSGGVEHESSLESPATTSKGRHLVLLPGAWALRR